MSNYNNHFKKLKNKKLETHRVSLNYRSGKVRKKAPTPYLLGIVCAGAFCLALMGFLYPENMDEMASSIKIGFFSVVEASEGAAKEEKSAHGESSKAEKKSPAPTVDKDGKPLPVAAPVVEKPNYAQQLVDKQKELDEREKKLVELEEKLQQEKAELDKKIATLEQTRRDIASKLEGRVAQDEENINKLVGVYSNMKAQNAAQVISTLEEPLAIDILKRMKKQDAANILNFMDTAKAKTLSEKYSGY